MRFTCFCTTSTTQWLESTRGFWRPKTLAKFCIYSCLDISMLQTLMAIIIIRWTSIDVYDIYMTSLGIVGIYGRKLYLCICTYLRVNSNNDSDVRTDGPHQYEAFMAQCWTGRTVNQTFGKRKIIIFNSAPKRSGKAETPWKFNTSPLTIYHSKMKVISLQPSFFRGLC